MGEVREYDHFLDGDIFDNLSFSLFAHVPVLGSLIM